MIGGKSFYSIYSVHIKHKMYRLFIFFFILHQFRNLSSYSVFPCVCVQRLLQHPELSNSQLLADFLSPYSMESQFLDRMLPDVNLGTFTHYSYHIDPDKSRTMNLTRVMYCWSLSRELSF